MMRLLSRSQKDRIFSGLCWYDTLKNMEVRKFQGCLQSTLRPFIKELHQVNDGTTRSIEMVSRKREKQNKILSTTKVDEEIDFHKKKKTTT